MNLIGGDDPKGLSPISITARNSITLQLNFFQVPHIPNCDQNAPFGKSRVFFQLISQFPAASYSTSYRVAQTYETAHPHPPLQLLNSLNKTTSTCWTTLAKRLNPIHNDAHTRQGSSRAPRTPSYLLSPSTFTRYHPTIIATSELPGSIDDENRSEPANAVCEMVP
jgi:hypothetical protein